MGLELLAYGPERDNDWLDSAISFGFGAFNDFLVVDKTMDSASWKVCLG
nr:hypothetical protein Iba_chr03aCG16490 [Ipomoea batatas]